VGSTAQPAGTIAAVLDSTKDAAAATGGAGTELSEPPAAARSIETGGRSLRAYAARGVMVNGAFDVGISALSLIRGLVLAILLSRSDYGVWGVLVVSLGVLASLKVVGISDKYLQQDEPDQELAFQKAFTLEVLMTAAAMIPIAAALPVVALVYGQWKLLPPGIVLLTVLVADALQAPFWIYYRKMNFSRQRALGAIEPVVGFVVAIGLAFAGLGYWALAVGVVAGAWAGALAALITCPFRIRWRYDPGALRVYASFSGPIFVATASTVVLANATTIATNAALGLAGVGALALASNITAFTTRVDDLVSGTLYPAICAIQNRLDLLQESFVKSNRLALMWAMPFGIALTVFAPDLVRFVLGEKWHSAILLLQITGLVAAISQVGFNWDDYFRARADTRPIAVASLASTVALLGVGLPLLAADGLTGLAIGIGAGAGVHLAFRAWYLARLFAGFAFIRHAIRAMLPTLPAVAAVLAMRALETGSRTAAVAVAELAVYGLVTAGLTWLVEGALVREALGYLRGTAR
jgi:O-antigen/teichoic acid export membrane protein